jgi:hypothetical protein
VAGVGGIVGVELGFAVVGVLIVVFGVGREGVIGGKVVAANPSPAQVEEAEGDEAEEG